MERKYIIHIVFLILFLGCAGTGENAESSSCQLIKHRVNYTNKDTRSEARHGYLVVGGYTIPDVFIFVTCRAKTYKFMQRRYGWGNDGYFPVEKISIESADAKISQSELERGWYEGVEKKKQTPKCWLYVKWDGGAAFVAPGSMKDFIQAHDLGTIPRMKMQKLPGR